MWRVDVPRSVERALSRIPKDDRDRIGAVLESIEKSPFEGDIRKLDPRQYRRRVGRYRIIFSITAENRVVLIERIVRRTSTTY